jgi:hypothetical protein
MKFHISATIDEVLVAELRWFSRQEKRSFSNLLELAVEAHLSNKQATDNVYSTPGSFAGCFSRAESCDRDQG